MVEADSNIESLRCSLDAPPARPVAERTLSRKAASQSDRGSSVKKADGYQGERWVCDVWDERLPQLPRAIAHGELHMGSLRDWRELVCAGYTIFLPQASQDSSIRASSDSGTFADQLAKLHP